jgi:hypothetical protein
MEGQHEKKISLQTTGDFNMPLPLFWSGPQVKKGVISAVRCQTIHPYRNCAQNRKKMTYTLQILTSASGAEPTSG